MSFEDFLSDFLVLCIGYLIGSLPSGYLAGKWIAGIDLRKFGSGSTGATNVLRQVGKGPALIVFILDVSKGAFAIYLAKSLGLNEYLEIASGISALAGHIWPIWLGWKGGKAVATGLGVLLGISWIVGLASFGIFLAVLSLSKIVSLSSIVSAISLPILMLLQFQGDNFSPAYLIISLLAAGMVLWRHRSNWKRLKEGKEPRIGQIQNR